MAMLFFFVMFGMQRYFFFLIMKRYFGKMMVTVSLILQTGGDN